MPINVAKLRNKNLNYNRTQPGGSRRNKGIVPYWDRPGGSGYDRFANDPVIQRLRDPMSTGSTEGFSFADDRRIEDAKRRGFRNPEMAANPQSFTGGVDQYMPTLWSQMQGNRADGSSYLDGQSWLGNLGNQGGDWQFGSSSEGTDIDWRKNLGGGGDGFMSKLGGILSDPMQVANIGLKGWDLYNKNQQLNQNKEYMADVRKAMLFDQSDVNRRWDLTMADYSAREKRDKDFDYSQRLPDTVNV